MLSFICILLASTLFACGGSGGGGGGSDDAAPSDQTSGPGQDQMSSVTLEQVQDRLIVKFPIGSLEGQPETRNISRGIPEFGWDGSGLVQGVIGVLEFHGLRRADLHNPFGRLDGEAFQFDQYLEAQNTVALELAVESFVPAWRKYLTDPALGLGHIEISAYIGSPHNDPESYTVLTEQGEAAFFERAQAALQPFLELPMAIGLDASTATLENSVTYRLAEQLRNEHGRNVYVEAIPLAENEWWFDYPVVIRESLWQRRKDDPKYATRQDLRAEFIRYPRIERQWADENPSDAWPPEMCRVIAEGDSLMADDFLLREPARSLQGLVDCANALVENNNG